jgi:hypothetical protein
MSDFDVGIEFEVCSGIDDVLGTGSRMGGEAVGRA